MIARQFLSVEHGIVSRLKKIMNFAQVIPPETYMGSNSVFNNAVPIADMSLQMEDLQDEVEIVPDMDSIPDFEELPELPEFPIITPPGISSYDLEHETKNVGSDQLDSIDPQDHPQLFDSSNVFNL